MLFARLVTQGVGRPVDKHDFADGPWTPETLADAIATIDSNKSGIDVRTVQVWFQANDNGISDKNIHWLARIFGCDDPVATSQWQSELKAAKERLAEERRSKNKLKSENVGDFAATPDKIPPLNATSTLHVAAVQRRKSPASLASKSERLFLGGGPFGMVVVMWASIAILLFTSYLIGVHDIAYTPVAGIDKQVGLFWSPNWLLDRLLWLPLLVFVVSSCLTSWSGTWRPAMLAGAADQHQSWETRLEMHSASFWGITLAAACIIFLLQWYGSYLYPLLQNDAGDRVVDWLLIALERPEVMSTSQAIGMSVFANLLSGVGYWYCFTGLLLLYLIASDYTDICSRMARKYDAEQRYESLTIANSIVRDVFTCAIFSLLASTGIKLVATYLMTDTKSLAVWLITDAGAFLAQDDFGWSWFDKSPTASITSFFVMFIPVFVFFVCLSQIHRSLQKMIVSNVTPSPDEKKVLKSTLSEYRFAWLIWSAIIVLLVVNFWSIGRYTGFSILLVLSSTVALCSVVAARQTPRAAGVFSRKPYATSSE